MKKTIKGIAKKLGISEGLVSVAYIKIFNEAPKGSKIALKFFGYFAVENYTCPDKNKRIHYVLCDLDDLSSMEIIYDAYYFQGEEFQKIKDSLIARADLSADQSLVTAIENRWLPIEFLMLNDVSLENINTEYQLFMCNDGVWGNIDYEEGEILEHNAKTISIIDELEFEDVLYVRVK